MRRTYFTYILASKYNGTLYVGVTNDMSRRHFEHLANKSQSFTKKYGVYRLVHVESYDNAADAIQREKNLKKWKREWKIRLIEELNHNWSDLSKTWL